MGNFKVKNVNVEHKIFLDAAEEYAHFIPGIDPQDGAGSADPGVNSIAFGKLAGFQFNNDSNNVKESAKQIKEAQLRQRRKRVTRQILDRTSGIHFIKDWEKVITQPHALSDTLGFFDISNMGVIHKGPHLCALLNGHDPEWPDSATRGTPTPIKDVVAHGDPGLLSRKQKKVLKPDERDMGSDAKLDPEGSYKVEIAGQETAAFQNTVMSPSHINSATIPDKFSAPSLGAVIIKDHAMSIAGKQSSHLPVFLNAIPPIEMSRCTPYIDFRIITEEQAEKSSVTNNVSFLGFSSAGGDNKSGYDMFRTSMPQGDMMDASGNAIAINEFSSLRTTYMDAFTSPQTMVNPSIGRGTSLEMLINHWTGWDDHEDHINRVNANVIDPMQPFMTLINVDINVTGIGHGLLATKRAKVKIKLHDKSRINLLGPILSQDAYGFTKIYLEFGWSHPDSGFLSKNTIGKYLNGLRDSGYYTLVNASYSFGTDNSVDITLDLTCSGFQEMKTIHAGCGSYTNIRLFDGLIEKAFQKIRHQVSAQKEMNNRSEIRSKLSIAGKNMNRSTQLAKFEKMAEMQKEFSEKLKDGMSNADAADILSAVFKALTGNSAASISSSTTAEQLEHLIAATGVDPDASQATAGDLIFCKLYSLLQTVDPFRAQTITESDVSKAAASTTPTIAPGMIGWSGDKMYTYQEMLAKNDPHVTLGKLITNYVGYPMAAAGIFDEVQIIFYPVNNHAGAARKHTTASLPIPFGSVEEAFKDRMGIAGKKTIRHNLTVSSAFASLDKIVSDKSIPAYGLYSADSQMKVLKDWTALDSSAKLAASWDGLEKFQGISRANIESTIQTDIGSTDAVKVGAEAMAKYQRELLNKISTERSSKLAKIYAGDGTSLSSASDKFVPINLAMMFESGPAIDADKTGTLGAATAAAIAAGGSLTRASNDIAKAVTSSGYHVNKNILRIHIYDQEASQFPSLNTAATRTRDDGLIVQGTELPVNGEDQIKASLSELEGKTFGYWKSALRSFYPTIVHGTTTGVVKGISVQSQTAGKIANIHMVESYAQRRNSGGGKLNEPDFDEVILFPTVISLELAGNPMISRGTEIFIDFNTNTSLDNIYVVKALSHTIGKGEFTTVCTLVPSNQGAVRSHRDKTLNKLKTLLPKT